MIFDVGANVPFGSSVNSPLTFSLVRTASLRFCRSASCSVTRTTAFEPVDTVKVSPPSATIAAAVAVAAGVGVAVVAWAALGVGAGCAAPPQTAKAKRDRRSTAIVLTTPA